MFRHREPYLVSPGKRKNNPNYIIRGPFGGKPDNEKSTGTDDEELAERMLARLIYNEKLNIEAKEQKNFRYCADQYIAKNPNPREIKFLDKLCLLIGPLPIDQLTQSDLINAANSLYPGRKSSTKNRSVIRPASAVIHYAAKPSHKWCSLWQVELFEEAPVKKRVMPINDVRKLIKHTTGLEQVFLIWLHKTADRVTSALGVEGKAIHLNKNYYEQLAGKKKKHWRKASLDPELKNVLIAHFGAKLPAGKIFPWRSRWAVYRWTKPLCEGLNIPWTPHVARHSILSWIGDAGGNSIQIKARAGHASLKSSEPYLAENLQVTQDITAKFDLRTRGNIRGMKARKRRKHK